MNAPVALESRSFKVEDAPAARRVASAAALELTASDGTGLVLVSLSARIVVEDPLAFTELHLVFQNPEPRQLEGRFRIGLPSGASVSRFAMRIGAQWQEGEVVERQAARRAYEDFLHRRQDPALLEHEAGNEFSARVFPIEAGEQKEIIVSYSHELTAADDVYRLPLVGLPKIDALDIRAMVGRSGAGQATSSLGGTSASWQVVEVRKTGWKPDVDFEVRPAASGRTGLRHGNLVALRVTPELPREPDEIASLLVLVDTSASRALGHDRQVEVVRALARGLALGAGPATPLAIACFDQGVSVAFEGKAGDFSDADARRMTARLALGASDLAGALRWAAEKARGTYERVLLVSDGVATAGDTAAESLTAAARALEGAGVKRLDAIAAGGLRDDATLRRLVTAGLERDGTVCDGESTPAEIAARLTRATRSGIRVEVPGAAWVWPSRLDGVQPGESALVYADVPADREVTVLIDKKPVGGGPLALDPVERPLLSRAWVKARIQRLEEMRADPDTDPDVRAGLQKQIVQLSVEHRVLSPYTALLVLETEYDYARFNIDRRALADILTVGLSGVEVLHRTGASVPVTPASQPGPMTSRQKAEERVKKKRAARPPRFAAARLESSRSADIDIDELEVTPEEAAPEEAMSYAAAPLAEMAEESDEVMRVVNLRLDDPIEIDGLGAGPQAPEPDGLMAEDRVEPDSFVADYTPEPDGMMAEPPRMEAPAPRAYSAPSGLTAAPRPAPAMAPAPAAPPPPSPAAYAPEQESPGLLRRLATSVTDMAHRLVSRPEPPAAPPPPPPPPAAVAPPPPEPEPDPLDAWTGKLREVMELVLAGKGAHALDVALTWRQGSPGDVLALVAIGEAAEQTGDLELAARAYGSLIDLYPSRADLRRFAGERLSRLASREALELAIDTFRRAVESRPDHPSGHRLLGMALLRAGRPAEAFEAIAAGQARSYPDKFPGIPRILAEDLGLAGAAWIRADPSSKPHVEHRLALARARLEDWPSVRFVLVWETDANDVDFHIHDAAGGHAYYREKVLPSGGELYADVTQGYGPECFTIPGPPQERAYPYKLQAHYFRQGPMGFGMGSLQIVEHDGEGGLAFEERPYVVMRDRAFVDLGTVAGPLPTPSNR